MKNNSRENDDLTQKKLHVKLFSPYKIYFDDQANSVSAESATGPFDILQGHHNFLTLLEPCNVVIRQDTGELKFKIARGVMHVKQNSATIFLDV